MQHASTVEICQRDQLLLLIITLQMLMKQSQRLEAFLVGLTDELQPTDTDLLNIRDEMLSLVRKAQYLLTLN